MDHFFSKSCNNFILCGSIQANIHVEIMSVICLKWNVSKYVNCSKCNLNQSLLKWHMSPTQNLAKLNLTTCKHLGSDFPKVALFQKVLKCYSVEKNIPKQVENEIIPKQYAYLSSSLKLSGSSNLYLIIFKS